MNCNLIAVMIKFVNRLRIRDFLSTCTQIISGAGFFMFYDKIYPYILVFIQLSCLVYILVSGPLVASGYAGIFIECLGIFLGVYAIFVMKIGNFNISSKPKKSGKLVTSGPYTFIRHPMYTAQLLALLPLVIDDFSYLRLATLLSLLIVLLLKVSYEEQSLKLKFDQYKSYSESTKKLIPFIF